MTASWTPARARDARRHRDDLRARRRRAAPGGGRSRRPSTTAADPAQVRQLRARPASAGDPGGQPAPGRRTARRSRRWTAAQRERPTCGPGASPGSPSAGPRSSALRKLATFLAYADPGGPDGPAPEPAARRDRLPAGAAAGHRRADVDRAPSPCPSTTAAGRRAVALDADVVIVGLRGGRRGRRRGSRPAGRSVVVLEAGPFVDEASMPTNELDAFDRLYLTAACSRPGTAR